MCAAWSCRAGGRRPSTPASPASPATGAAASASARCRTLGRSAAGARSRRLQPAAPVQDFRLSRARPAPRLARAYARWTGWMRRRTAHAPAASPSCAAEPVPALDVIGTIGASVERTGGHLPRRRVVARSLHDRLNLRQYPAEDSMPTLLRAGCSRRLRWLQAPRPASRSTSISSRGD